MLSTKVTNKRNKVILYTKQLLLMMQLLHLNIYRLHYIQHLIFHSYHVSQMIIIHIADTQYIQ